MIFKKKELKLYVVQYECYGVHRTIIEATDEIDAMRKVRRQVWQGPGMEYPNITGIIPFREATDAGNKID